MNKRFTHLLQNGSVILLSLGFVCLILFSIQRAPEPEFSTEIQVEFPRYEPDALRRRDSSRPYMRKPQPSAQPKEDQPTAPIEPDPVLRGLRAIPESDGLMVLEANAIKHSWLFEALEGCIDFQSTSLPDGFPEDFDITESIDRVATGDGVALVSGFFDGVDWESAIGSSMVEAENAQIFDSPDGQVFAIWDNQMMITAESRDKLDTVLEGLNNPSSVPAEGGIEQSDAYGDIYGKFNGGLLERLVPEEFRDELTPELVESLNGIDFHLDMSQGLAMSASVTSESEDTLKALNFVMDLGLSQARNGLVDLANEADAPEAAALSKALKASQIGSASDGVLNFDLALPRQVMEDFLRETCSRFREESMMEDEGSEEFESDSVEAIEPEAFEDLDASAEDEPYD